MRHKEIENQQQLTKLLATKQHISFCAFQDIDFFKVKNLKSSTTFNNCIFLGCKIPESLKETLHNGNLIFPKVCAPFNAYPSKLYNRSSLFNNYILGKPESYEDTFDKKVYNHYIETGKEAKDIKETLLRRLHDHSISDALYDFVDKYDEKKVVAIMGGHNLPRNDKNYLEVAKISKKLTEKGYLMLSGGGPGAMEATHVGAWFAGKNEEDLRYAISILAEAPVYKDKFWLDKSFKVLSLYPDTEYESVGIPTWLYGHEPPNPFATQIAKYFANSVREDGLLSIAKGGVIFSPGNAGTIQEIFQDATQNHYLSFGYASPMVFFNCSYWSDYYPIFPFLSKMSKEKKYKNMILSAYDTSHEVVNEILKFGTA